MGIINIIRSVKQIHEKDIVLVRIGKFYYSYGKDAYILSYLFQYKLVQIKEESTCSCAFPQQTFPKVTASLENKKINYIVVDRRNNYDIEEKSDNKNLNCYQSWFEKAKAYINMKQRIDKISETLIENINKEETKEKIKQVEEIIYEGRKI